jgi:hypothetical protein
LLKPDIYYEEHFVGKLVNHRLNPSWGKDEGAIDPFPPPLINLKEGLDWKQRA